jgi:hypothetical protein
LKADRHPPSTLPYRFDFRKYAHLWNWLTIERRYVIYALLVQALLIVALVLALTSPKLLDTLTTEKTVRGMEVEGPVDRASGYLLFGGALLSTVVAMRTYRQARRLDWFWTGYGGILLLAGLEESDWLKQAGLSIRFLGHRVSALHDVLTKLVQPLRAGAEDYPLAAPYVVLLSVAVIAASLATLWLAAPRLRRLDVGLLLLIGLGVFFGSLGTLIDADLLPKPVAIDWKAHLEEPLETIGALCLALVSAEGLIRARRIQASPRAAAPARRVEPESPPVPGRPVLTMQARERR